MQLQTVPRMRGRDVSRRRETLSWSQGTPRMRGRDVSQLLAVLPLVGVLPACAGAMLRDMARKPGQRDQISQDVTFGPTLADLGIERTASHRWQWMADGATLEATAAAAGVDPKTVGNCIN